MNSVSSVVINHFKINIKEINNKSYSRYQFSLERHFKEIMI